MATIYDPLSVWAWLQVPDVDDYLRQVMRTKMRTWQVNPLVKENSYIPAWWLLSLHVGLFGWEYISTDFQVVKDYLEVNGPTAYIHSLVLDLNLDVDELVGGHWRREGYNIKLLTQVSIPTNVRDYFLNQTQTTYFDHS